MSEEHPYTVVKTATFDSLLRDIVWYLRDVTEGVSASLDLIDKLEQAASQLAVFPPYGGGARERNTCATRIPPHHPRNVCCVLQGG